MDSFVDEAVIDYPISTAAILPSLKHTESSKAFEALKAIIFSEPIINQAKIQFLKEELTTNRYKINSQRIAEKLTEYQAR